MKLDPAVHARALRRRMPPKRDRRHNNPGRPKLKASEKQSSEVKTRVTPDTERKIREAAQHAGLVPYQWLRWALEVLVDEPKWLERIELEVAAEGQLAAQDRGRD